jgi:hypothetical protein
MMVYLFKDINRKVVCLDSLRVRTFPLPNRPSRALPNRTIQAGFLDSKSRQDLAELARDGSAAHRLARRANALVLLGVNMSYAAVAKLLLLDDETIRPGRRPYEEGGIEGLASFGYEGSACRPSDEQQDKLKAWTTPRRCRGRRARVAPGSNRKVPSSITADLD